MPYRVLRLLVLLLFTTMVVHAQALPNLVVAWIENGDVWVWRAADNSTTQYISGKAVHPYISPDGRYIAFTTVQPSSLWLIEPNAEKPIEIVPNTALAATDTEFLYISNLEWGVNDTLYFNTFFQSEYVLAQIHDLWLLDGATHVYKQVLPLSQGGIFTLSPDRHYIALTQPGTYNDTNGSIRLLSTDDLKELNKFTFPAVSTASNYDFYPKIDWTDDSQSINVTIPDKDIVYHDDTALTTLWRLGIDGLQTKQGILQASFFSLPRWSNDGQYLTYLRHKGNITTNQYELIVAAGDGSHPQIYASGIAGTLGNPEWLPDSHQFMYPQFDIGSSWIGQLEKQPKALPSKIFQLLFVNDADYVYASPPSYGFELNYANLNTETSNYIGKTQDGFPIFDAVIVH